MSIANPLFTVAVVTYNSSRWIDKTIKSILSQTFGDFEILICDDCSTDNTREIIAAFTDERIRVVYNPENIKEYNNRNKALKLAAGRYIIYIDGDDIFYKDSLAKFKSYIDYFPQAGGIWGVCDEYFDFVVLPYEFSNEEMARLIFFSLYPISVIGFAESLYKTEALRSIGGFSTGYAIGDTYIKKRFACSFPVVLTTRGYTFWRQTSTQASKHVNKNYRSLIENYSINKSILNAAFFPLTTEEKNAAVKNSEISVVKLIIKNTLFKGKIFDFFKLMHRLQLPLNKSLLVFNKLRMNYKCNAEGEHPLINNYNFKSN